MRDDSFKEYVIDLFTGISGIEIKRMFGGWGVYKDESFFALISDGELYFKVDKNSKTDYTAYDSHPFVYTRKGKQVELSFWLVPEEVMEDRDKLFDWVIISSNINKK